MRIYLDHNSTTPPHPEVVAAMAAAAARSWGNPSSLHWEGRGAREVMEAARRQVANLIRASATEIIFTSGGTEGNNTAILGAARQGAQRRGQRGQVIASPLEHPSVRSPLKVLADEGFAVRWLPVDRRGRIDPADLRRALQAAPTTLVTLALVNHEIGNLYPIAELAQLCREHEVPLHCDAVQAAGRLPLDAEALGADLLTLSAHKLHGPKGVGALYVRARHREIASLLLGGQQEKGRRAGTESVPAIAGFGAACQLAQSGLGERSGRIAALRDLLEARLLALPGAVVHGDTAPGGRAPGTCNAAFAGVEGELLMMSLDLLGAAVSTGAACSSGSPEPSPVLLALGCSPEEARTSVRFSLGAMNTEAEVGEVSRWVREIVERVRALDGGGG